MLRSIQVHVVVTALVGVVLARHAAADTVVLTPSKDASLFEYDVAQSKFNVLRSNSKGDFIAAGRSRSNDQIQRGLIQFELDALPSNAVITSASLTMRLIDVATRAENTDPVAYWLEPVDRPWGEPDDGSAIDLGDGGAGRGTDSLPGDATWLHTHYWPDTPPYDHGTNPDGSQRFTPDGLGYWAHPGALAPDAGQTDGRVTRPPSESVGTAPFDLALNVQDDFLTWSSAGMARDLRRWQWNLRPNYGWFILGDESIVGSNVSSKRGFASREYDAAHAGEPGEVPSSPTLTVEYALAPTDANVVDRHVFYNDSAFDGDDPAANAADDAAIAVDKQPLMPGQTATFRNVVSYEAGINGVMIDIANRPDVPISLDDFVLSVGDRDPWHDWQPAPQPAAIDVRPVGSFDRVTLTWPDGAIQDTYLAVAVLPGLSTGLPAPDVFLFGSAVGETGNQAEENLLVTAADLIGVCEHPRGAANRAAVTDPFDFNRDRLVDGQDLLIAQGGINSPFTALPLLDLSLPAATPVPEPSALWLVITAVALLHTIRPKPS